MRYSEFVMYIKSKSYVCLKRILVLALVIMVCGCFSTAMNVRERESETYRVLDSAESVFKAMKERDHAFLWSLLSFESRERIAADICSESKRMGIACEEEDVMKDMGRGGFLARSYWRSFMEEFDPDSVLQHSRWRMGMLTGKKAEVIILHEKAESPAILRMFKEESTWKVGLEETFRPRRMLLY